MKTKISNYSVSYSDSTNFASTRVLENWEKNRNDYIKTSQEYFKKLFKKSKNYTLHKNEVKNPNSSYMIGLGSIRFNVGEPTTEKIKEQLNIYLQKFEYYIVYNESYKNQNIEIKIPIVGFDSHYISRKGVSLELDAKIVYGDGNHYGKNNKLYINPKLVHDKVEVYVNTLKKDIDNTSIADTLADSVLEKSRIFHTELYSKLPTHISQPKTKESLVTSISYFISRISRYKTEIQTDSLFVGRLLCDNGFALDLSINLNYTPDNSSINVSDAYISKINYNLDSIFGYNDKNKFQKALVNNVDDFLNKMKNFDINYDKIKVGV